MSASLKGSFVSLAVYHQYFHVKVASSRSLNVLEIADTVGFGSPFCQGEAMVRRVISPI